MARRTTPLVLLPLIVFVVVALFAAAVGWSVNRSSDSDSESDSGASTDLTRFTTQELTWSDCDDAECTSVEVPTDYENPGGGTVELQVKVFPATGEGGRRLFINPGGPGGSVIGGFDDYMAQTLGAEVRERYDVVAVDPRGVGSSEPVDCLSDDDLYELYVDDQTPDDQAERSRFGQQWSDFGSRCRAESGDLASHLSTEETARDFDIVREALGAKTFDWFGFSYGARLGATYATLFPTKVGRMVLDGAEDPALDFGTSVLTQAKGFEVALRAFVEDCAEQESCPLGSDPEAAVRKVSALIESLDTKPMKTSEGDRPLTEGMAYWGLIYPLYDNASWPDLRAALAAAIDGDGTPLLALGDAYLYRLEDGSFADNWMEAFPLVLCQDTPDRVAAKDVPAHADRFAEDSPVFGRSWAWGMAWCEGIPTSDHPQVAVDAHESAPIVVIGTTRDPATPYKQSIALAEQLGSAVFVTREGDGHTAYAMGNSCIDDLVDAYLARGTVPKDKTVCAE